MSRTRRDIPSSYGEAARLLNLPKPKDCLTIANNTVIVRLTNAALEERRTGRRSYDEFGLLLHDHLVVTWHHSGAIVLDSCGWRTVTTKDRINRAQNVCRVGQTKGVWYLGKLVHGRYAPETEEPFYDGIVVTDTDQAIGAFYDRFGDPNGPTGGDTGD